MRDVQAGSRCGDGSPDCVRAPHRIGGIGRTATLLAVVTLVLCAASSSALASGDVNTPDCGASSEASPGFQAYMSDCRAYEMVTPLEKNGLETGPGAAASDGSAVDWQALGACCGASSAADNLFRSSRTANGWQTKALTPTPARPLAGLFEEQVPMFWSADLSQTIFTTPASYAAGDERPEGSGAQDLYLEGPIGQLTWLSQGPSGTGTAADTATFDAATPDAKDVVFSSAEQLTPDATGLESLSKPPQYLYLRDVVEKRRGSST